MSTVTDMESIIDDLIKSEIEQDQWDMPPMLVVIQPSGDMDPETPDHKLTMIMLMIDTELPVALWQMAETMMVPGSKGPWSMFTGEISGIIIRLEGWALIAGKDGASPTADDIKDYTEAGGRISEHPQRREMAGIIGTDGEVFISKQLLRGDTEAQTHDEKGGSMSGRVPDALKFLLNSLRTVAAETE